VASYEQEPTLSKHPAVVLSAVAAALAVAACGSSSSNSSSSSATSTTAPATSTSATAPATSTTAPASGPVTESADPSGQLKFTKSALTAKAGKVTIEFTNSAPLPHNIVIAQGSKTLGGTPTFSGGTKTLMLDLVPGTYTFYCSVPGHRAAGMEGTLTVQ
jgi:plastocyanin